MPSVLLDAKYMVRDSLSLFLLAFPTNPAFVGNYNTRLSGHKSDVEASINIKLRLDEDIGLAGDVERPLIVFVETKSRPILKYPYEVQ